MYAKTIFHFDHRHPPTPVRPKSDNNSYWSGRVRSLEITKVRAHTHTHTNNSIHFFSRSLHPYTMRPLSTHIHTHANTLISYIIYMCVFFPFLAGRGEGRARRRALQWTSMIYGKHGNCDGSELTENVSPPATTAATATADGHPEPPGDATVGVRAGHTKQLYLHLSDVARLAAVVFPL